MSEPPPDGRGYEIGQIVDGHVLAADGKWYRIEPPPAPAATALVFDPEEGVFRGTLSQVMRLAARAITELGWTVTGANDTIGLVVFETGVTWGSWSGVTGSITFTEAGSDAWRAEGSGKQNVRGGQTLAIDFGEADSKVHKAIEQMVALAAAPA